MTKAPHTKKDSMTIGAFFGRFHAVLFVILVCGSLTIAVYMLSTVLDKSSTPDGYTPPSTNTSFDTETIKRVEGLRGLEAPPAALQLPEGRVDPFMN